MVRSAKRPLRWAGIFRPSTALVVAVLLQGCSVLNRFDYARDVGSVVPTRLAYEKGNVTISWKLGSPEWVSIMCRPMGAQIAVIHGCAMLDADGENCLIIAVEPTSFQDRERLAVLGHEAWHCFGALHG
jgi:hypothetical protein